MALIFIAIIILVVIAVISFSSVAVIDVMGEMNNCKLWIQMNSILSDEEYRDKQVGFTSYPETTNEGFFNIRFHADFYECDRWFDYDQVLADIVNERIGENYFDDMMFWSTK